jgi:NADH-quinone oxidoreductase subunit J
MAALVPLHVMSMLATATLVDRLTFGIGATIIILGAVGVVIARNPVHSALMLVMTLFGVAVLFVEEGANFLAAVQVIVYAGAIVVLFLFVIMFLGVDREENLTQESLPLQRPLAIALMVLGLAGLLFLAIGSHWSLGPEAVAGSPYQSGGDVASLGRSIFTTYLFPFEITAGLLVIAVVGAVVLARRPREQSHSDADLAGGDGDPAPVSAASAGDGVESTESVARAVAGTVSAAQGRADDSTTSNEEGNQ